MIEDIPYKKLPELVFSRDMLAEYITVQDQWEQKTGIKTGILEYSKRELELLNKRIDELKGKSDESTEL